MNTPRKMSWLSWNRLCLPKSFGGMSFQNMLEFSQSLLAKKMWRMMINPTSPVAQIFSNKYKVCEGFLKATDKLSSSSIWSSII